MSRAGVGFLILGGIVVLALCSCAALVGREFEDVCDWDDACRRMMG